MKLVLLNFIFIIAFLSVNAGRISGSITNPDGDPLPFASLIIKGTSLGTTSNSEGQYFFVLAAGTCIIVCQHVGYEKQEKTITVLSNEVTLNFQLVKQELTLREVIVTQGEDPPDQIIRQAIKKRVFYRDQV